MRGRDPQHADPLDFRRDDARRPVDLHVRGLGDQLGREERLVAEAADASARVAGRRVGHLARAFPVHRADLADEVRDRDGTVGRALHARHAVGELEVVTVGLELFGGRVEQLLTDLLRRREDRAAVVEGRLRPARPHVPRRDVGVLVQDRDVVRIDPELLPDEHRHRHHGAAAVLLRAGHDRGAAVAVHPPRCRRRSSARTRPTAPACTATTRPRPRSPRRRADRGRTRSCRRPSRGVSRIPTLSNTCRVGPSAPSSIRVRRRRSTGSMPIAAATSSMCCSSPQQTCGAVGARTEPDGWLFV